MLNHLIRVCSALGAVMSTVRISWVQWNVQYGGGLSRVQGDILSTLGVIMSAVEIY